MNIQKIAEETVDILLKKLNIVYESLEITVDNTEKYIYVTIKGNDLGILIGIHGRNLDSLKIILSLLINKVLGHENAHRVVVNVNDYSERRQEQLKHMIESAKNIMSSHSKNSYSFPPMNASDRRILHTLAAEMGLRTQSDGEGRNRHVNIFSE